MQKTLKIGILIFVLLSLYSLIGAASAATTYTITDSSYNNYFNKSGYINNTSVQSGDILDLSGEIKNKNMYIDRPLNITSSTKTAQILNGTITILSGGSGTNVTDLKISNSNIDGIGIFLYQTENNTIKGNQIHCNGPDGFGIALSGSNHNYIINNTVLTTQRTDAERTHTAVVLGESNNNTIGNNTVKSDGANCIYLSSISSGKFESNGPSNNNKIINNTIVGVNTQWCYVIQIAASAGSNNTVEKNKILSQTFPEKSSPYGIGAYRGISVEDEGGNTIIDNTISAIYYGIYASSNCIISGNTISNYGSEDTGISGIFVAKINNIIANNTINMTYGYGIYLMGSNNSIVGNNITTNGTQESIYLYGPVNNITISGNTIKSKNTGIMLKKQSSSKHPTQNTINNNYMTSISTYAVNTSEGSNNTITNNYLVSDNGSKIGDNAVNFSASDTVNDNTPAMVTLTPVPGYYKNSILVTLTINLPGNIYYTTNGNTPTSQSTLYNTPINITSTTVLKFITVDEEGNISPVQTKTYTIDAVAPVISSTDPKNNAVNVPTSKTIKVTFNENIKKGSNFWIELKNSSKTAIPFTTSINGKTLNIDPTNNLAESLYTLCIHTGAVTDLAGNPVALKTIKFTAGTPPSVTKYDPANGATKIASSKTIKVTFNENIKKGNNFWIELKNSGGKAIAFKSSVNGKVLTIDPTSNLAESLYTLCIHTGAVTDLAGNPVAVKSTKFSVGTSPTVAKVDPANNAAKVARNKVIRVTFNENIKASSSYWIELKASNGKSVNIGKSIIGKVLTITHSHLAANTKYTLILHTGAVTDNAGNPVAMKTCTFTTGSS